MPDDNDTLQLQQQQIQIQAQEQEQTQAAPQQVQEQRQEPAAGPAVPQPEQIQEAAPAPVMEEPAQQQEMTWKERRAARRQAAREARERQRAEQKAIRQREREAAAAQKARQQEDRAIAQMQASVQPVLQQMKRDPALALQYEASASTAPLLNEVEALEQCFLAQYQASHIPEREARKLLDRIRILRNGAHAFDQNRQDYAFEEACLGEYIRAHELKMPQGTTEAFLAYGRRLSNSGQHLRQQIGALRESLFPDLNAGEIEQRMAAVEQVRTGAQVPAYQEVYAAQIQAGEMTLSEARAAYEEQTFRARRPITLRSFEEQRKAWQEAEGERSFKQLLVSYDTMAFANQAIREQDPRAPQLNWEQANALAREYLEEAVRNSSFQIRVPNCEIMGLILDSGRFKTQMETNSSRALLDLDTRKNFSQRCFGIDPEALPPEQYEIYGYASHGDLVRESASNSVINQGSCQYGHIVVTLRKERMLERTTITIGDSLSNQFTSRMNFVHSPDLQAVGGLNRSEVIRAAYLRRKAKQAGETPPLDVEQLLLDSDASYAELQYHGGVRVEDIESVTLMADPVNVDAPEEIEQEMPAELVERLRELDIRAYKVKDGELHEL